MALRLKEAIYNLKMKAPKGAPDEFVTISIGGAVFPSLGKRSFEDDLKIVDKHLYKAKQNGKNQACLEGKIL